jgi:error-prone DNA polymerase
MGRSYPQYTNPSSTRGPCAHAGGDSLRLGLRQIRGISEALAHRLVAARAERPFDSVQDLAERAGLNAFERTRLADAGALRGLAGHRHRARWAAAGAERQAPLFAGTDVAEDGVRLAPPSTAKNVWSDYEHLGLTLDKHPLALLRRQLAARRVRTAAELRDLGNAHHVRTAGLVTIRQRPATASGVTFVTMEDETGATNIVVWRDLGERCRQILNGARLLGVDGKLELVDGVQHVIAAQLHDYSALLGSLDARSRDFR